MAKGKSSNTKTTKSAKVVNASTASSGTNAKKIIAIIVAVIAIIILLLCLTCCNKDTDPKKLQGKVIEDKNKKEDKKEEVKDVVINYNNIAEITPAKMAFTPNKVAETKEEEEKDTTEPVVTLDGDDTVYVEYMTGTYTESGATYSDDVDGDGTIDEPTRITLDGNSVESISNEIIGEYTLIYTYTDEAGNTGMATRTVIVSDTKGPKTNISVSVRRVDNTDNSNYTRSYAINSSDPSDVKVLKIMYVDGTTTPAKDDFDDSTIKAEDSNANGIYYYSYSVTEPRGYGASVAGNYYVYSEDTLGNYNIRKVANVAVSKNDDSELGAGNHVDVTFDEVEGYEVTEAMSIHGQSRLKSDVTVTDDSFSSVPTNYTLVDDHEIEDNTIVLTTVSNTGDHWHYVYCNYENGEDGTTQEFISNPIAPDDY